MMYIHRLLSPFGHGRGREIKIINKLDKSPDVPVEERVSGVLDVRSQPGLCSEIISGRKRCGVGVLDAVDLRIVGNGEKIGGKIGLVKIYASVDPVFIVSER